MDLATWRAQREQTLTLPSGLTVRVRRVQLLDLAAQGMVPAPLHDQVQALINHAAQQHLAVTLAEFPQHAAVIDMVVTAAVIDPPIAAVADEAHLAVSELEFADRLAIFSWAHQEASALATFPGDAGDGGRTRRGRRAVPLPPE